MWPQRVTAAFFQAVKFRLGKPGFAKTDGGGLGSRLLPHRDPVSIVIDTRPSEGSLS